MQIEYAAFAHDDRRRQSFRNVDRYSMQWVYGWPDYDAGVSNLEWEVGTARALGLPVPSLAPFVGAAIGTTGYVVDAYGDNLARASTPGGDWLRAHNSWLATVFADCAFAGLRVSGELQGLFRACIPLRADRDAFDQRPWSTRRGIVPDGMVTAGLNGGAVRDYLLECKFVHWGVSTYTRADIEHRDRYRSVARRAEDVPHEYVAKAARMDARHCGTVPATRPGPVETRLISYGEVKPLVVGHYAEVSAFVEKLAGVAAAAGAVKYWRMMRCRDPDAAYGVVLQMLRRSWGMAAFRENARLVVRRLTWVRDARAPALVVNMARDRDRMGRRYENAMEHHPRSGGRAVLRPSRAGECGG